MSVAVLAAVCGCGKGDYDTLVTIRPRIMKVQSSPAGGEPAYMVRIYACYIAENEKTDTWYVASYDDADAGIFTNKKTGERRSYSFMAEQPDIEDIGEDETETYVRFIFSRSPVLLVAVDPMNHFYAYRVLLVPTPMPDMQVTVRFVLWKPEVSFKDSDWVVVNGKKQEEQAEEDDSGNNGSGR